MWVGEKYNEAADPKKQEEPFWTEAILTQACLYYFSGCIMPSMLTYYENERHHKFAEYAIRPENRIQVPFGYTSFFWDTEPSSKRAVERTGNLVFYKGNLTYQSLLRFLGLTDCAGRTQQWRALCCSRASCWYCGGPQDSCP